MERFSFSSPPDVRFDVVVVGGGITGAAMAHQAAAQGLRVALFEKSDFGSATSSATSKLIHGGLRYLKNGELSLVRQSLRERRILGSIAANLVRPLRFVIPNYQTKLSSKLMLMAGMSLYDMLSFDKRRVTDSKNALPSHQRCSPATILELAPFLDDHQLAGGISYYDYANINPDRMTLAFLKAAHANGAQLANYARVVRLVVDGSRIVGVDIFDQQSQALIQVRAQWVINCTGAWVDSLAKNSSGEQGSVRQRSEGVHLITSKFHCHCATVLQMANGQHLMFLPWRGLTIVGPTDRAYHGNPSDYKPTRESVDELIENINLHIPAQKMGGPFTRDDILFHYGGLRPLVDSDTSSQETYSASRRHEILEHRPQEGLAGLISVEGGKYTTSRGLAEKVVGLIGKRSGWNVNRVDTSTTPLSVCVAKNSSEIGKELFHHFGQHYLACTIDYYASNYGVEAQRVLELGLKLPDGKQLLTADGEIMAEADYAIREELVYTLSDLLLRRTGIGWMGKPLESSMKILAEKLSHITGWTKEQQHHAIERFYQDNYILP